MSNDAAKCVEKGEECTNDSDVGTVTASFTLADHAPAL